MKKITKFKGKSLNTLAKKYFDLIKKDLVENINEYKYSLWGFKKYLYNYLSRNNFRETEKIICGNPIELNEIANYFQNEINNKRIEKFYGFTKNKPKQTRCGKFISNKIFDYKNLFVKKASVRDFFLDSFELGACYYCNRQNVNLIESDKTSKTKFLLTFDHFYPQVYHPYLSLSFFNLIPCCHICNTIMKGTENFTIGEYLHPYQDDFDKLMKFQLKRKNIDSIIDINDLNFDIELIERSKKSPKAINAINNAKVFELENVYKYHKDYAKEIEIKKIIYNDKFVTDLFDKYKTKLSIKNIDALYNIIYGNYINEDDINKRPLSKLTKDLLEDD